MKLSNSLMILLYAVAGLGIYAYIFYGEQGDFPTISQEMQSLSIVAVVAALSGICMGLCSNQLEKLTPWRSYFGIRFLLEWAVRMLIVIIVLVALTIFQTSISDWETLKTFGATHQALYLKTVVVIGFANILFIIASFTFFTYNQFAVVQIQSVELKRKQLQLQFDMLRSQLSPHYLFNCLNTISNLVYKDSKLAEEFIRRFAHTYQYVLRTHKERLIPLSEEIKFVKAYCFLLQTRFSDNISLQIDLTKEVKETVIPPLTLQILVENAVKHNVISEERPLEIKIYNQNQQIYVQNTLSEKPKQVSSLQVGLKNINRRYAYFTNQQPKVSQSEYFEVSLPILEKSHTAQPHYSLAIAQ